MASLRVVEKETSLVPPAGPALPARSVALTFFDVKWLHLPPVERVFLYRLSPDADVAAIVAGLKASLAKALRAFYPLAGRVVRLRLSGTVRHELRYRPGDAVPFTAAEMECDMDKLASDEPVRVAALAPLVPQLPKGRAVLAVQATTIVCSSRIVSGLAVGVTVHHSACDGAGSTHFLHAWAGAGGADHQEPPALDRAALIPDPRGLYDIYLKSLPPTIADDDAFEFVSKPPEAYRDKLLATFTLPKSLLERIKAAVAGEAARRGVAPPPRCSTTLAAYAFMWSCHCRCSQQRKSSTTSRSCYFLFSVDQRARLMNPPVPATYLGNCLCPAIATAPEDHLAAPSIVAGLFAASTAVAAALEEQVREGAQDTWDTCVDRVKQGVAHGMLSVAGSPRFRVYDMDFGLGRPAKVHMVSAAKGGAMPVAEARAGGGGVEVGVSLPADGMDRFQNTFAQGIAYLSSAA
ncbi:unnamed protein product [Urochloa decumbens]|uniref:Uncharacterized protein n=1 Tax=Urochloa decumbens TaxID=240449 RepID=A0ABC8X5L0_9POAL